MENKLKNILKFLKFNESSISTILGGMIVVVIGILVYKYFTSLNKDVGRVTDVAPVEVTPGKPVIADKGGNRIPAELPVTYKVKEGDSLWTIAEKFYNSGYNWVDIATENKLDNPALIEVGQEFSIPKVEIKQITVKSEVSEGEKIQTAEYEVVSGDYLWNIALRAYGDGYAWKKIYEANKETIGNNPNVIKKHTKLTIPPK